MLRSISLRTLRQFCFVSLFALGASGSFGCSGEDPDDFGSGGSQNVDASGGQASGGNSVGGSTSGGATSGGQSSTGGASTGGASSGGASPTGGAPSGGASGGDTGSGGDEATGGDSSSGGDSGEPTGPCPETGPCKILPLGDSITFGMGSSGGGYRVELFRLAVEAGHDITFTGTQSPNGPDMVGGVAFPKNHAGISGETIEQIRARIPDPDLEEVPHIILIHAGTNDMWSGADGAPDRLQDLVDILIAIAPDALIVVSNLIPWPAQSTSIATFNAAVPGVVELRAGVGAHVIFVDQFADFPEDELDDGIHPNDAGYARMAAKWYEAIETYLP